MWILLELYFELGIGQLSWKLRVLRLNNRRLGRYGWNI